jgi:hypothetical protein
VSANAPETHAKYVLTYESADDVLSKAPRYFATEHRAGAEGRTEGVAPVRLRHEVPHSEMTS